MIHYYGLEAIGARLGVSRYTVRVWILDDQLLAYRRRAPRGLRRMWYSNEALLLAWEIARSRQHVHEAAQRYRYRDQRADVDNRQDGSWYMQARRRWRARGSERLKTDIEGLNPDTTESGMSGLPPTTGSTDENTTISGMERETRPPSIVEVR